MRSRWLVVAAVVWVTAITAIAAVILVNVSRSADNVSTLVTSGRTTSAMNAAEAKTAAAEGKAIIKHVENQLDMIMGNSATGRQLICSIATAVHISTPVVVADCPVP